jgi:hypothetical protein
VSHPIYRADLSDAEVRDRERAVAPLMAMPEAEMVAIVPDRTGFLFVGCPNCDGGAQEGQLGWTVADPNRVTCQYCDMVFPNEQYPEDQSLLVVNPVGEEVEYPYWENDSGYRHFFSAKAWRQARVYLATWTQMLGELYQATGDRDYARRAVLILDAFARYYPGFIVSEDRAFVQKGFALEPPYPIHGGKWGRWHPDEMPSDLVFAYDAVCDSGELERLSDEVGMEVRARIENDLFRAVVRHEGNYPPTYDNMSPRICLGYAVIGRVLGDASLVYEAVRRSKGLFELRFFLDGMWCEGSLGYHRAAVQRGMGRVFDALRSHSDPPRYVDGTDGARFENLDLERDVSNVARAQQLLEDCRYPDGRLLPIHDCNCSYDDVLVPLRSASRLLTGYGHAWLGAGEGASQIQAHLHFSGGYGHEHADNLSLALFAKGHELLSDLGYTHTRGRAWATSTLCHNTVVIDEEEQFTRNERPKWKDRRAFVERPTDGCLTAFETRHGAVQWMSASAERAYPGRARVYERTVFLIDAGEPNSYVVDLFRVEGGSQHDWVIHGNADLDSHAEVSVPLESYGEHLLPGVEVRHPENERDRGDADGRNPNYACFQNVQHGQAEGDCVVTFRFDATLTGLRSHLPGPQDAEAFLGDAPSIRRAEENDALVDRDRMPIFMARRQGKAQLCSAFAAIHEPFEKEGWIRRVARICTEEESDAVALQVDHNGVTDHVVHRVSPGNRVLQAGDLALEGEVGFVRERDGVAEMMGLWGGTRLRWRDQEIEAGGVLETEVQRTLREEDGDGCNGLVVDRDLPDADALIGATVVVTFGDGSTLAYVVKEAQTVGGESCLVLDGDPGVAVDQEGARHLFFPLRDILGRVGCRIRTSSLVTIDRPKQD